jgi:hypothetical protein
MSKIRERILRGEGAHGTPQEAGEWIIESISKWTEDEKRQAREKLDQQFLRWAN